MLFRSSCVIPSRGCSAKCYFFARIAARVPQETLLRRLFPLCDFFARLQRGMLFLRADPTRVPQETPLRRLFLLCDFLAQL